jgi:hypothetical protein
MNEAVGRSERRGDPFRAVTVHMCGGALYARLGDEAGTLEHAQALNRLAAKQPVWTDLDLYTGEAPMMRGNWEEAVTFSTKSNAFHKAVGLLSVLSWGKLSEAQFFAISGQFKHALPLLDEVIRDTEESRLPRISGPLAARRPARAKQRGRVGDRGRLPPPRLTVHSTRAPSITPCRP